MWGKLALGTPAPETEAERALCEEVWAARKAGPPRYSSPVAAPDASFLSPTKSYTRQGAHGRLQAIVLAGLRS